MPKKLRKDNVILANFDFVVDLDMAIFRFMRDQYYDLPYVDKKFLSIDDEREVIYRLLNRPHINPLELIIKDRDTTELYLEMISSTEVLKYATAYDTFPLLITFLNNASSVDIFVRCDNKEQKNFINRLNPRINTIVSSRKDINLDEYSVIYEKYFAKLLEYDKKKLRVKHIYIAAAKFNMEENQDRVNYTFATLFADVNQIHLMDLYRTVKFRFKKSEDDNNEDLL